MSPHRVGPFALPFSFRDGEMTILRGGRPRQLPCIGLAMPGGNPFSMSHASCRALRFVRKSAAALL